MQASAVPDGTRTGNELIDRLGEAVRADFLGNARRVFLAQHEDILSQDEPIRRVYFPTTAVLSLLVGISTGQRSEYCSVGCEGMVGVSALLGRPSQGYAIVQVQGEAWALEAAGFRRLGERHRALGDAVLGFVLHAMRFAAQSGICNACHSIEQRLARWLLTHHDRAHADQFPMTQDTLATILSASRPRVSEAAQRLRAAGLIDYHSSQLRIVDRRGLEAAACECYFAARFG